MCFGLVKRNTVMIISAEIYFNGAFINLEKISLKIPIRDLASMHLGLGRFREFFYKIFYILNWIAPHGSGVFEEA